MRGNVNRPKLLQAWGVTEIQADARFAASAGSTLKLGFDPKGHDWHELYVDAAKYYPGKASKKKVKLFTCVQCRFFAKSVSGAGQCSGLSRKVPGKTVDKWESLKASPSVRRSLAEIWGISVADATTWHRSNSQG